jgi:hypothetical protein
MLLPAQLTCSSLERFDKGGHYERGDGITN